MHPSAQKFKQYTGRLIWAAMLMLTYATVFGIGAVFFFGIIGSGILDALDIFEIELMLAYNVFQKIFIVGALLGIASSIRIIWKHY